MALTENSDNATPAVVGRNTATSGNPFDNRTETAGVVGQSQRGHGVVGITTAPAECAGVWGEGIHVGVHGQTENGEAVRAWASGPNGLGVFGQGDGGGVFGNSSSDKNAGVTGRNVGNGSGVVGLSLHNAGVFGRSEQAIGIVGEGGDAAALFRGTVRVEGDITVSGDVVLSGADYAEALSTTDPDIEAGNVVVLGPDGGVHLCDRDYDTAVAGIVSGAGGVKPAIVLDRHEGSADVALIGKVWCKADADPAPIRPGDLLTTSATIGHCRRVTEPARAFGAVIGKALTPLCSGQGLVRVLVSPR